MKNKLIGFLTGMTLAGAVYFSCFCNCTEYKGINVFEMAIFFYVIAIYGFISLAIAAVKEEKEFKKAVANRKHREKIFNIWKHCVVGK